MNHDLARHSDLQQWTMDQQASRDEQTEPSESEFEGEDSDLDLESDEGSGSISELDEPGVSELDYCKQKSELLKPHFSDTYLEVFNQSLNGVLTDEVQDEGLNDSTLGAVLWTAKEKAQFFAALSSYGRHDLPRISAAIKTKSQLEVNDYLQLLDNAFVDRQLFERETKNASHADFPAAVEISTELESRLEKAADALNAIQDGYDLAAGQQKAGNWWLVGRALAKQLDTIADQGDEKRQSDEELSENPALGPPALQMSHCLFRIQNWLDLAENYFMNSPPETSSGHWSQFACEAQRPSFTVDAILDFHNLAVSITQRILQVAIFVGKSRIRATMIESRPPAKILTRADVCSAIDILGMKHNNWDFWVSLPRRWGYKVVEGKSRKRKGKANSEPLIPYPEVEDYLSQMSRTRARRSQSRSRSRSRSQSQPQTRSVAVNAVLTTEAKSGVANVPGSAAESDYDQQQHESENASRNDEDSEDEGLESTGSSDPEASTIPGLSTTRGRKRRRSELEKAHDEYMEQMDQRTRQREERDLWQVLGESTVPELQQEDNELGRRPKTLRKDKDELHKWSCSYQAEWELLGRLGPVNAYVNDEVNGLSNTQESMF